MAGANIKDTKQYRIPMGLELSGEPDEQLYWVDDFRLDTVIWNGRFAVYADEWNSQAIALKTANIVKHPEKLDELRHERAVYDILVELQGHGIPKLVCHGYIEGLIFGLGFSWCGRVPDRLDQRQAKVLMGTLAAIHERGVVHQDIRRENIVVDEGTGDPSIIDFSLARCRGEVVEGRAPEDEAAWWQEDVEVEMEQMERLIASLQVVEMR